MHSSFKRNRSSHRDGFSKYLFIFSRSNLFIIFQGNLSVRRKDMFFPGGFIKHRHVLSRRVYLFVEQTLSHRTDTNFPRNPLVLEHIRIFQEPLFSHRTDINFQELLFSHRTDIHFPGSPILSSNTYYFPGDPYASNT